MLLADIEFPQIILRHVFLLQCVILLLAEGAEINNNDNNIVPSTEAHQSNPSINDSDFPTSTDINRNPLDFLNKVDQKTHELLALLDHGTRDCYFQQISSDYIIKIRAGIYYNDAGPAGTETILYSIYADELLKKQEDTAGAFKFEDESKVGGTYSICIDNTGSSSAKVMKIQFNYYRLHYSLPEFDADLDEKNIAVANFMLTFANIEQLIYEALDLLYYFKAYTSTDQKFQLSSQYFITFWSFFQCAFIIGIGALQIYFVKKLFENDNNDKKRIIRSSNDGKWEWANGKSVVDSRNYNHASYSANNANNIPIST